MFSHSNEVEEVAVVNLSGVNLEVNPEMEALLGVRVTASCQGQSRTHIIELS